MRSSICFLRAVFWFVSSLILLQFWHVRQVDVVGVLPYGSRRTTLTLFPIQSLGTMILAEVAHGLAIFSMTSKPCMCISMGFWATVFSFDIKTRLQLYCNCAYKLFAHIYCNKNAAELNTHP